MKLKKYRKAFPHSYTLGIYTTIELLKYRPKSVLKIFMHLKATYNKGVKEIQTIAREHNIPIESASKMIDELSDTQNTYALGIFNKYEAEIEPDANHVVLVNPQDPGNVGTIMRTMLGFGLQNLVIIQPAVDVFDPKALRASMGSLFQLNFAYFDSFQSYQNAFPTQNYYPFISKGKAILPKVSFQKPFSLIFGSESDGLSPEFEKVGTPVTIPQSDKIDSLNLAMAAGIAIYQSVSKD